MIVYVVLHDNYGDQGVDFHGVFATRESAEKLIADQESDLNERQYWMIIEAEVR